MSTSATHHRTLWEEGQRPGRLVAVAAGTAMLLVVALDALVFGQLTLFTDICFVLVCAASALLVRPQDFFVVGVCPPLVLLVVFGVAAAASRGAIAEPSDGFLQAVVSGLAHHAGALVVGYGLTLGLLAVRQVALRNAGTIRSGARPVRVPR